MALIRRLIAIRVADLGLASSGANFPAKRSGLPTAASYGIALGGAVVLGAIAGLAMFLWYIRRGRRGEKTNSTSNNDHNNGRSYGPIISRNEALSRKSSSHPSSNFSVIKKIQSYSSLGSNRTIRKTGGSKGSLRSRPSSLVISSLPWDKYLMRTNVSMELPRLTEEAGIPGAVAATTPGPATAGGGPIMGGDALIQIPLLHAEEIQRQEAVVFRPTAASLPNLNATAAFSLQRPADKASPQPGQQTPRTPWTATDTPMSAASPWQSAPSALTPSSGTAASSAPTSVPVGPAVDDGEEIVILPNGSRVKIARRNFSLRAPWGGPAGQEPPTELGRRPSASASEVLPTATGGSSSVATPSGLSNQTAPTNTTSTAITTGPGRSSPLQARQLHSCKTPVVSDLGTLSGSLLPVTMPGSGTGHHHNLLQHVPQHHVAEPPKQQQQQQQQQQHHRHHQKNHSINGYARHQGHTTPPPSLPLQVPPPLPPPLASGSFPVVPAVQNPATPIAPPRSGPPPTRPSDAVISLGDKSPVNGGGKDQSVELPGGPWTTYFHTGAFASPAGGGDGDRGDDSDVEGEANDFVAGYRGEGYGHEGNGGSGNAGGGVGKTAGEEKDKEKESEKKTKKKKGHDSYWRESSIMGEPPGAVVARWESELPGVVFEDEDCVWTSRPVPQASIKQPKQQQPTSHQPQPQLRLQVPQQQQRQQQRQRRWTQSTSDWRMKRGALSAPVVAGPGLYGFEAPASMLSRYGPPSLPSPPPPSTPRQQQHQDANLPAPCHPPARQDPVDASQPQQSPQTRPSRNAPAARRWGPALYQPENGWPTGEGRMYNAI